MDPKRRRLRQLIAKEVNRLVANAEDAQVDAALRVAAESWAITATIIRLIRDQPLNGNLGKGKGAPGRPRRVEGLSEAPEPNSLPSEACRGRVPPTLLHQAREKAAQAAAVERMSL